MKDFTHFIDIGNTAIKVGEYLNTGWKTTSFDTIEQFAGTYPSEEKNNRFLISSVRSDITSKLIEVIGIEQNAVLRSSDIPDQMMDYQTPESLGIDRFLSCLGAYSKTHKSVVVIDAGTACTIDYMDDEGVFQGGLIMPGFRSLLQIFKSTAPELPEIEETLPAGFPGKNTTESLQHGQVGLFKSGIESAINEYQNIDQNFEVFITGGDTQTVVSLLNMPLRVEQNLIFDGMLSLSQSTPELFVKRK
jgi:type III pantothenate kinase